MFSYKELKRKMLHKGVNPALITKEVNGSVVNFLIGVSIPLDDMDEVISGLKSIHAEPDKVYSVKIGKRAFRLPGSVIPDITRYLTDAKYFGGYTNNFDI